MRRRDLIAGLLSTATVAAAREVHARIDAGGLGGKIVLLPWPASRLTQRRLQHALKLVR
jgi:hypothetical protein